MAFVSDLYIQIIPKCYEAHGWLGPVVSHYFSAGGIFAISPVPGCLAVSEGIAEYSGGTSVSSLLKLSQPLLVSMRNNCFNTILVSVGSLIFRRHLVSSLLKLSKTLASIRNNCSDVCERRDRLIFRRHFGELTAQVVQDARCL